MSENKKKPRFKAYILVVLLVLLFLIIGFFYIGTDQPINQNLRGAADPRIANGGLGKVIPIQKTEQEISAEKELTIVREIEKEGDLYTVKAHLKNVDALPEGMQVQDLVDNIRFSSRVDLSHSRVEARNGYLFPPGKSLNVSSYGPGPVSKKRTAANVAILDLNFNQDSENTDLYEMKFNTPSIGQGFSFYKPEARSGKYILEIQQENHYDF